MQLKLPILELGPVTMAAYKAYPNEADAYAAQAEADKGFRAQPTKPAKVPPAKAPLAPR